MNAVEPGTDLVSFGASRQFPVDPIVLRRSPLCRVECEPSSGVGAVQLYEYLPTENTQHIHAVLLGFIEDVVHAFREDGQHEKAQFWWTLRSLARFGILYPPMRRDSPHRRLRRVRWLPEPGKWAWKRDLAPTAKALRELAGGGRTEDYGKHPLRQLHFEARYPDDSALGGEPPEDLLQFMDATLVGELQEGEAFVRRLEQRGRRNREIGLRLRQVKMLGECANVHLVGLTFQAILRQIATHLRPEEQRWFAFRFLPNDTFGGTVVEFDPVLSPLLSLDHAAFRESAVRFWALGDESARQGVENVLRAYLMGYPSYADAVIQRMREQSSRRRGAVVTDSDPARSVDEHGKEGSVGFGDLIGKARFRRGEAETPDVTNSRPESERAGLTSREKEVFELWSDGERQAEIGRKLGISQQMVSRHLRKCAEKIRSSRWRGA